MQKQVFNNNLLKTATIKQGIRHRNHIYHFLPCLRQDTTQEFHKILALSTLASSKDSDKPVHLCSLLRAFATQTHEVW